MCEPGHRVLAWSLGGFVSERAFAPPDIQINRASMTNTDRFDAFLRAYAAKDLEGIAEMLSEGAALRDWDISVRGRQAVISATKTNFDNAATIAIEVLSVCESRDCVAAELRITVDTSIELYVVDVIQFDASGKVLAIRSYKGRSD